MIELCEWYTEDYEGGCLECEITKEETSCCGDVDRCECEQWRQRELRAAEVDRKADADREKGGNDS